MSRGGKDKVRGDPERRCIATGEVLPKARLIRFVVGPDNLLVPDLAAKLPGRGIWVKATKPALQQAVAKKQFSRHAGTQVTIPDGLVDDVEVLLVARLTNLI